MLCYKDISVAREETITCIEKGIFKPDSLTISHPLLLSPLEKVFQIGAVLEFSLIGRRCDTQILVLIGMETLAHNHSMQNSRSLNS